MIPLINLGTLHIVTLPYKDSIYKNELQSVMALCEELFSKTG